MRSVSIAHRVSSRPRFASNGMWFALRWCSAPSRTSQFSCPNIHRRTRFHSELDTCSSRFNGFSTRTCRRHRRLCDPCVVSWLLSSVAPTFVSHRPPAGLFPLGTGHKPNSPGYPFMYLGFVDVCVFVTLPLCLCSTLSFPDIPGNTKYHSELHTYNCINRFSTYKGDIGSYHALVQYSVALVSSGHRHLSPRKVVVSTRSLTTNSRSNAVSTEFLYPQVR